MNIYRSLFNVYSMRLSRVNTHTRSIFIEIYRKRSTKEHNDDTIARFQWKEPSWQYLHVFSYIRNIPTFMHHFNYIYRCTTSYFHLVMVLSAIGTQLKKVCGKQTIYKHNILYACIFCMRYLTLSYIICNEEFVYKPLIL